jgi:cytochrome b561
MSDTMNSQNIDLPFQDPLYSPPVKNFEANNKEWHCWCILIIIYLVFLHVVLGGMAVV